MTKIRYHQRDTILFAAIGGIMIVLFLIGAVRGDDNSWLDGVQLLLWIAFIAMGVSRMLTGYVQITDTSIAVHDFMFKRSIAVKDVSSIVLRYGDYTITPIEGKPIKISLDAIHKKDKEALITWLDEHGAK